MKDPWRQTTREWLWAVFATAATFSAVVAVTASFAYLFVFKVDAIKTDECAKHGMRMSQVRSWSGPVCRDDRGVLYDFGG